MQTHARMRNEGRELRWFVVYVLHGGGWIGRCLEGWKSCSGGDRGRTVGLDVFFVSHGGGRGFSQMLLWRDDYIMAVLFWLPAKRNNATISHGRESPSAKLVESPHSCNSGSWLVTATINDTPLAFRDIWTGSFEFLLWLFKLSHFESVWFNRLNYSNPLKNSLKG